MDQQPGEFGGPFAPNETDAHIVRIVRCLCAKPRLFRVIHTLKKMRTTIAFVLATYCLIEGLYCRELPFNLAQPNLSVLIGLLLILAGLVCRLGALGCLRKKQHLATGGVYSLCRHPLYLGSILLAYGFCILLADMENFVLATAYFIVFYPLTIVWEESRLAARYGQVHRQYCRQTPVLFPFGAWRSSAFSLGLALSRGGSGLLLIVVVMLIGIQVMAKTM